MYIIDKKKDRNKKKKKGFTLVELLGTIAVLAVIALILIPIVTSIIDTSRRKAFQNSVYHAMDSIKESYAADDFKEIPKTGVKAKDGIDTLKNNSFIDGVFKPTKENNLRAVMVTDGRFCALGTKEDLKIDHVPCSQLDDTEPELEIITGLITSNSIQVVAKAYDEETEIIGYQYSKDNGKTWTEVIEANSYTFTKLKNGTSFDIKVRAINETNLIVEKGVKLKTLDIPLPTYTSNPGLTTWSKNKVVTIHYPERKSNFIYEYSIDNGKTWVLVPTGTTQDVTFTSNGNLTARIRDGYNVIQAATLTITTIDISGPTIPTSVIRYDSSTGSVRGSVDSWTNKILWWGEFKSTDTGSGIDHYEYSDGCTGSKTGNLNSSYTYSNDMNKRYCIRAVDKVGNASGWSSVNYFKVDRTNPTCGTIAFSGTVGTNGWYRSNVTVNKTNGSDAMSGHASTTVSHSSITADTKGTTVTLTTKDNAGNSCKTTRTVKVDKTNPTCGTISFSGTAGNNGWYRSNVTVNKTNGSDATSGHASTTVSHSSVTSDTKGTTVTLTTKDNAGNSCSTSKSLKVDKTPPSFSSINNPTNGNWTNKDINLTYYGSDGYSGIAYWQWTYNTSSWNTYANSAANTFVGTPYSAERNQLVYIRAVDKAGNISAVKSTYIRIDKHAASLTYTLVGYGSTTGSRTFNIPVTSSHCGGSVGETLSAGNTGPSAETYYYTFTSSSPWGNGTQVPNATTFNIANGTPNTFAGSAGNKPGYGYIGSATGVLTMWSVDQAGNRSNTIKSTINWCVR